MQGQTKLAVAAHGGHGVSSSWQEDKEQGRRRTSAAIDTLKLRDLY